jgi:hypothetical protein
MTWTTPRTWESLENLGASDLNVELRDNLEHLYANLPTRAVMWHEESTVVAGNALARTIQTSAAYNYVMSQNTPAINDEFTNSFVVGEGTYTLYLLGATGASDGQVDWYVDDVLVASAQDWYSASPAYNQTKTVADVVIAEGGYHVLKGIVAGKNASSSNYRLLLTKMWLAQASDT